MPYPYQAYKSLPNHLKKYRKARGLKQREVAALLGHKNPSRISKWETGRCLPNLANMIQLAIIFRVDADDLFWNHRLLALKEIREGTERVFGKDKSIDQ